MSDEKWFARTVHRDGGFTVARVVYRLRPWGRGGQWIEVAVASLPVPLHSNNDEDERLILAAPEMLAMLERWTREMGFDDGPDADDVHALIARVRKGAS